MSRGKKWILRGLAVLGILCALGAALVFGLSGYVVLSTRQQFRTLEDTPPEAVDCILVLGCGVYADGTPTPMLSDRLTRGVELYQAGWASAKSARVVTLFSPTCSGTPWRSTKRRYRVAANSSRVMGSPGRNAVSVFPVMRPA